MRNVRQNETKLDVVIAGGGPTGLMLAAELALAGVDVAIVERRASQELEGSRAMGLHARTLEVFDQRGIADRFVSQGQKHAAVHFQIPLDISDLPTRHNYTLGLWQRHTERILAEWVGELNVPILRGRAVTGFEQDENGVDVALSDGRSVRAAYLVGCDGGRSAVRKIAGMQFAGYDATTSWLIVEAQTKEEPVYGFRLDAPGTHGIGKSEDGRMRAVLTEPTITAETEPTLRDIQDRLNAVYGTDFGIHDATWISRFTDMTRQAATYRDRRVLLAGDAAHVHSPMGGQGLNLGVQDAVNLGWKLAQVVKCISPDSLLDTYHAERHPVAARALRVNMAQVALRRADDRTKFLGDLVSEWMSMDEPRKRTAVEMCGLGIRYDVGEGHPMLGRRMPDLDLIVANHATRCFTLLHAGKPVFLNLREHEHFDIAPWRDRVDYVDAKYDGAWELPALGDVDAPEAVLIRPDGYVAWVDGAPQTLADALTTWFGPPRGV